MMQFNYPILNDLRGTIQRQRRRWKEVQTETIAFSRREAADALRISLRMLDYLLATGGLRGRRIGRRIIIPKTEVEKVLNEGMPNPVRSVLPKMRFNWNR